NRPTSRLVAEITEGDKGISFDGEIKVFKDENETVHSLIGRIPVQIKGTQVKRFSHNTRTVAAQSPCRETGGFFLPRMTVMRDNEWRVQPEVVPPFIVQGAAKATNKKGRRYGLPPRLPFHPSFRLN